MSDDPTRYVPTDQDLRSNAIYTAERLVTEQLRNAREAFDPIERTVAYADVIFKYIKEGQTNG